MYSLPWDEQNKWCWGRRCASFFQSLPRSHCRSPGSQPQPTQWEGTISAHIWTTPNRGNLNAASPYSIYLPGQGKRDHSQAPEPFRKYPVFSSVKMNKKDLQKIMCLWAVTTSSSLLALGTAASVHPLNYWIYWNEVDLAVISSVTQKRNKPTAKYLGVFFVCFSGMQMNDKITEVQVRNGYCSLMDLVSDSRTKEI